jgi:hypothetical protein
VVVLPCRIAPVDRVTHKSGSEKPQAQEQTSRFFCARLSSRTLTAGLFQRGATCGFYFKTSQVIHSGHYQIIEE